MPVSWAECMLTTRLRSFQRETVISVGQKAAKLRSVKCPWLKAGLHANGLTPAGQQNFFSSLQLWQLLTLLPFDPQRPKISLWKDLILEPVANIVSNQETGSFLKIVFAISKLPCFHSALSYGICIFFATAVSIYWDSKVESEW